MRSLKGLIAGALAFGGLMLVQGEASASPLAEPGLIHVSTVQPGAVSTEAAPCYYGWHRRWGWRPHYWHRGGWGHRPWGWHRHRGWRRHYGWHRHW